MIEHGVEYPVTFMELELREGLLKHSQSNVTPDHVLGLQYAAAAYDKALSLNNPLAASEAASKAGLRNEQAEFDSFKTDEWFSEAYAQLPAGEKRERASANLNHGRALSLRLGRLILRGEDSGTLRRDLQHDATDHFSQALGDLNDAHDPYKTMAYRHFATFEAMIDTKGSAKWSIGFALRGIGCALVARQENANNPNERTPLAEQAKFKVKQLAANAGVLALAGSKLVPGLKQKRIKTAVNWLV